MHTAEGSARPATITRAEQRAKPITLDTGTIPHTHTHGRREAWSTQSAA